MWCVDLKKLPMFLQGETVPYAICIMKDAPDAVGDTKSLANRAFHPEEVVSNGMEVDKMYYLAHQVLSK